jgi:hypothetical protein
MSTTMLMMFVWYGIDLDQTFVEGLLGVLTFYLFSSTQYHLKPNIFNFFKTCVGFINATIHVEYYFFWFFFIHRDTCKTSGCISFLFYIHSHACKTSSMWMPMSQLKSRVSDMVFSTNPCKRQSKKLNAKK